MPARCTPGGDQSFPLADGVVTLVPPGTAFRHHWRRAASRHFYALFVPGRSATHGAHSVALPVWQRMRDGFEDWFDRLARACARFPVNSVPVQAVLWDFLWALSENDGASSGPRSYRSAMDNAIAALDRESAEGLGLDALARAWGFSRTHFVRLFRKQTGMTVTQYRATRRWERARFMLDQTDLPIKQIAAELGFHDLSHFGKFVRAQAGKGPREVRGRRGD